MTSMIVIPALDLRDGGVVRLQQGDYQRETRYALSPVDQARAYQDAGAEILHLVDLDAARDGGDGNLDTIAAIAEALSIPVQAGGGVRDEAGLARRLDAGIDRVVLGSLCVRSPDLVIGWLERYGPERIVAGLDVRPGDGGRWIPQAAGWTEAGDEDLFALLERLKAGGLRHLLCTDITRDGMLTGSGRALYRELTARYPDLVVQASGGIGEPAHLAEVAATGVAGCIVGRALLEGRVPLDVLAESLPSAPA
ncbi:HisA/HisF-related TIM barrel protein [Wenzhouxiangella sp. XN79A]|uniref:HisA/HisF-related TIM barrel protein n=1 Tax=Wenzhouxiangella sp. XN79A TaxID=2724193 RepID=UPI00197F2FD4|nr:HisA/HisF-related TIM barrel protein [Wenzhouxiangella sp. XN79A]